MAKRRDNHAGTISKRASGGYQGRIAYTDPATGKTTRTSVYGKTATEVRGKLAEVRKRVQAGAPAKDSSTSVAAWMAQWRTTTLLVSDRAASTKSLYDSLSRKHLETPPFGAIRLDRLRPTDIEALILAMRDKTKPAQATSASPNPDPVRALAGSTIRSIYTVLRAGLDAAVRDQLLASNPAAKVKRPGVERQEARHLSDTELDQLLDAVKASRSYPVVRLIAATGMRRGEALGLSWKAVDLDARLLKVTTTLGRVGGALRLTEPKTARSRRVIPLSAPMVTMLQARRTEQKAERLAAGDQWQDSDLVFTTERGAPMEPRNLLRVIQTVAKRLGLDDVDIHTLRHSLAVSLLDDRTHIRAVADLLGHSSISITGDIYGHTTDDTARAAIEGRSARLGL